MGADRSHLTGHPKDATDVDLVNALCGLTSRIADVPSDPNGSQARDPHQMRADLDAVRAEVLCRMATCVPATNPATPHTTKP